MTIWDLVLIVKIDRMVFRFYWSNFREFISREMLFGAKTMLSFSFSYITHVFDHMGPGFDRLFQCDSTGPIFMNLNQWKCSFMTKQCLTSVFPIQSMFLTIWDLVLMVCTDRKLKCDSTGPTFMNLSLLG